MRGDAVAQNNIVHNVCREARDDKTATFKKRLRENSLMDDQTPQCALIISATFDVVKFGLAFFHEQKEP